MKNIFKIFTISALVFILCAVLTSCGNNSVSSDAIAEICDFKVGYLTQSDYNDGDYSDASIMSSTIFESGVHQYMVIDFRIKTLADNGGESVQFMMHILDRDIIKAEIEDAPTGKVENDLISKALNITAHYNIPTKKNEEKTVRMIMKLIPIPISGEVGVNITMSATNNEKLLGTTVQRSELQIGSLQYTLQYDLMGKKYYTVSGTHDNYSSSIVIPSVLNDGIPVTSIGYQAFQNCTDLKSVTIPDSVTSIGNSAFYGCSGLTSIILGNGVTSISSSAFLKVGEIMVSENNPNYLSVDGNLYTKDGKTLIHYAYTKTEKSFMIPDSVTSISDSAFYGCSSLTSIIIPNSVTSIGGSAFYGCSGLTSIIVPDGITSVGDYTFSGCSGLTSMTIPNGMTSIGNYAFLGCSGLTSIMIPDGVTSIGYGAFSGCSGLTRITIPDGVTNIGHSAFSGCSSLTRITIPDSVTSIDNYAFEGCSGLTSITIPDSIKSIGHYAFGECTNLTKLEYKGTVSQWQSISKALSWNYKVPATEVICSDGIISLK